MSCKKIFWLEDNPDFFSWFRWLAQDIGVEFDLSELLSRITFAYDFQSGKEIVAANQFDLYVLDGDFPHRLSDQRKATIDACVENIRTTGAAVLPSDSVAQDAVVYNNFVRFYKECLSGRQGVVVFSMSYDAIRPSCDLRLPFYFKRGDDPEGVVSWLKRSGHLYADEPEIDGGEYGSKKELLERYLLEQEN